MLSRSSNANCLEHGIKRCRVSREIHRIVGRGFPPIKGASLVHTRLSYHSIPSNVMDTFWCANGVMRVHGEQSPYHTARIHPGNVQVGCVDAACTHVARIPHVWCEPRLNERDPSRDQGLCHILDGSRDEYGQCAFGLPRSHSMSCQRNPENKNREYLS